MCTEDRVGPWRLRVHSHVFELQPSPHPNLSLCRAHRTPFETEQETMKTRGPLILWPTTRFPTGLGGMGGSVPVWRGQGAPGGQTKLQTDRHD